MKLDLKRDVNKIKGKQFGKIQQKTQHQKRKTKKHFFSSPPETFVHVQSKAGRGPDTSETMGGRSVEFNPRTQAARLF